MPTYLCPGPCKNNRFVLQCAYCVLPRHVDEPCVFHPSMQPCPVFKGKQPTCMLPLNIMKYIKTLPCLNK